MRGVVLPWIESWSRKEGESSRQKARQPVLTQWCECYNSLSLFLYSFFDLLSLDECCCEIIITSALCFFFLGCCESHGRWSFQINNTRSRKRCDEMVNCSWSCKSNPCLRRNVVVNQLLCFYSVADLICSFPGWILVSEKRGTVLNGLRLGVRFHESWGNNVVVR